jgi:hypothetical protein
MELVREFSTPVCMSMSASVCVARRGLSTSYLKVVRYSGRSSRSRLFMSSRSVVGEVVSGSKSVSQSAQVRRLKAEHGLDAKGLLPGCMDRVQPLSLMSSALSAGVHWGRASGQIHCDMRPYLLGRRHGAAIFDLRWTFRLLGRALSFLREAVWGVDTQKGIVGARSNKRLAQGRVLFVGEKGLDGDNPNCFSSKLLRAAAQRCDESVMGVREANLFLLQEAGPLRPGWRTSSGGRPSSSHGPSKKPTRNKAFVSIRGGSQGQVGVQVNKKLPVVALVLIGGHSEGFGDLLIAAKGRGCPVVSIVDSASSLKDITYPIPGNMRSVHSLYFFLDLLSYALQKRV